MKYLPLGLDIQGRKCVVVGGGTIGTRKARALVEAGGEVHLVSPRLAPTAREMADSGVLTWVGEPFRSEHLRGAFLAVAATDDGGVNGEVVRVAKELGALICDASSAERSEIIFGALHHGDGLTVATFTDGVDPSLARVTRDRIAAFLSRGSGPGTSARE